MNKITKAALYFGFLGIGVFAWVNFATAAGKGKPAPPPPMIVTFFDGDVTAEPQPLGGPFTASIDFQKYIPFICEDSPAGGEEVLNFLQDQNPITYDSLTISISKKGPLNAWLGFRVTLGGVPYLVTMNAFLSGWTESTATLNTFHLREGRFAVQSGRNLLVVAGSPVRQVELDFSMTK